MAKLIHWGFGFAQPSTTRTLYRLGSFRGDSGMLRPAIMQLILVFLFIITPLFSHAATLTWQQTGGPQDSHITNVVIDPSNPSILYVGTFGSGIYKSNNGGVSWSSVNTGLPGTSSTYMSLDPSSPTTLYVGTTENGIFKSTNGGESWSPINNGLTRINVHMAPVIDPTDPSTLYIGTEGEVFKSTNGGVSWSMANNGLTTSEVCLIAIDASNPSTIYAGLHYVAGYNDGGVFKSTNGGESWIPVNNGLPNTTGADSKINSLVIAPTNSQIVYAGTNGGGVFMSTNGGESWIPINNGLTNKFVFGLAIDPSNPTVLYIGTWGDGVFRSTNGGVSWSQVNSGLTNYTVLPLVFNPSDPAMLFAGTYGSGIFKGIITRPVLVDAVLALQVMSGLNPPGIPANYATSGADINSDGRIGLADAIYVLQETAGLR